MSGAKAEKYRKVVTSTKLFRKSKHFEKLKVDNTFLQVLITKKYS